MARIFDHRSNRRNLGNIWCLLYTTTLIVGARTREFLFVDNKSLRSTTLPGFELLSLSRLRWGFRRSSLSRRLSYLVVMPSRCSETAAVPLHQLSCTLGVVLERWLTLPLVPHLERRPSRSLFDARSMRLCRFAEVDIKWQRGRDDSIFVLIRFGVVVSHNGRSVSAG